MPCRCLTIDPKNIQSTNIDLDRAKVCLWYHSTLYTINAGPTRQRFVGDSEVLGSGQLDKPDWKTTRKMNDVYINTDTGAILCKPNSTSSRVLLAGLGGVGVTLGNNVG